MIFDNPIGNEQEINSEKDQRYTSANDLIMSDNSRVNFVMNFISAALCLHFHSFLATQRLWLVLCIDIVFVDI
jgi:hypothetical protein